MKHNPFRVEVRDRQSVTRRWRGLLAAVVVLTPQLSMAAEAAPAEPIVRTPAVINESAQDLATVYELALENDHTLAAARATYRAGLENRALGRAEILPVLTAGYSYSDVERESRGQFPAGGTLFEDSTNTDIDAEGFSVSLSQPVFDLPAWFRFQRGQDLTEQAKAAFAAAQQNLIVRTAEAYFQVLRAISNLQASRAQETALEAQLEQVKQRFDVGLVAITDVHEAQAAFDLAVAQRITDQGNVGIARELLSVLTGRRHANLWRLEDDFPVVDPEPADADAWVEFALENNYDIEAAAHARDAARQTARAAASEHLPQLSLAAEYTDNTADIVQDDLINDLTTEFPSDEKQTVFGLRLTMPLFAGGAISASRRQAAAQYDNQAELYAFTVRSVTQQTRALYVSVRSDVATVAARDQAITSTRSALEAAETGYQVGTRNVVDVLDAQRAYYSAIRDYANSNIDYVQDLFRLKRQSGTLSPDDIYDLNEWLEPPPPPSASGMPPLPGTQRAEDA